MDRHMHRTQRHLLRMIELKQKVQEQEMRNQEYALKYKYKKKIQTTKVYMLFTHILCLSVVVFSMYEMHITQNLDALSSLIAACVSDVLANGFYMCKSYMETNAEKTLELESAKLQQSQHDSDDSLSTEELGE